jgi:hypothetical protein
LTSYDPGLAVYANFNVYKQVLQIQAQAQAQQQQATAASA